VTRKIIRVGLDFDGVVAYNPFRIIRAPIVWFKREVLGINKLAFLVPKNRWQSLILLLYHKASVFPGKGTENLRQIVASKKIEFHLVTARYLEYESDLLGWLNAHDLKDVFTSIHVNVANKQPHEYKKTMINDLRLDYFVEDNLDIVRYLKGQGMAVKVIWVYNLVDRYLYKDRGTASLGKALEQIVKET
jgi:hypothetical protein